MKWLKAKDVITDTMNVTEMNQDKRTPNSDKEFLTPEPVSPPTVTNMSERHEDDQPAENLRKTFGRPNEADGYTEQRGVDTTTEEHPAAG